MKLTPEAIIDHASRYLDSAKNTAQQGPRYRTIAYDEARHSIELSGKALLLKKTGEYFKTHRIGGPLSREGLIPKQIDPGDLSSLLEHHTRMPYGYFEEVSPHEIEDLLNTAQLILDAAISWPQGVFHNPLVDPDEDLVL